MKLAAKDKIEVEVDLEAAEWNLFKLSWISLKALYNVDKTNLLVIIFQDSIDKVNLHTHLANLGKQWKLEKDRYERRRMRNEKASRSRSDSKKMKR